MESVTTYVEIDAPTKDLFVAMLVGMTATRPSEFRYIRFMATGQTLAGEDPVDGTRYALANHHP